MLLASATSSSTLIAGLPYRHDRMSRTEHIDAATRERLRAWIRYLYSDRGFTKQEQFANVLGISTPHLNQLMSGARTCGLDVVIKLHRTMHIDASKLLDSDPPVGESQSPQKAPSDRALPVGRRGWGAKK